jgi:GntR family transcriptional regulator
VTVKQLPWPQERPEPRKVDPVGHPLDVTGGGRVAAAIDRASPLPLYFQLASLLEEEIASGRWQPGIKLPSEPEMCEHYGLSRTTIRQAFTRLEQRGLIQRRKGQGTFVPDVQPGLWQLQSSRGFFHEVDRQSRAVSSEIVRAAREPLPEWACSALGLPPQSPGATLERRRSLDGLVAMFVVNHLPQRLADVALEIENPDESLYRRIHERAGIVPHGGRRQVQAIAAEGPIAELLELPEGAPVALIESVTHDQSGTPFDCYQAWLRTDRARIEVEVPDPLLGGAPPPD